MFSRGTLLSLAYLLTAVLAGTWNECDSYSGKSFLSGFNHMAIPRPHPRPSVRLSPKRPRSKKNLTFAKGDTLILRADHTTKLSASGPGRDSFRLMSKKTYTNHVSVWNVRHMPRGCGTWPALWEFGSNWPAHGEVDVVEGVNGHGTNQMTLHTTSGCTMGGSRKMSGHSVQTNCDVAANGNSGCSVLDKNANSYGLAFNNNGGGFYAMERSNSGVKVWFWPRHAKGIPADVAKGREEDQHGQHFGPHNIVINLSLCGDWAGQQSIYNQDGCPGSCVDNVNNNPGGFANAYFDIAWLKIYQ
ncbi:hypothetical protein GSI_12432 [Ganoderma sinense ZZ0214-1]|uniref:GH16 domain-containing protein n=1 Tax=Ganoderma sinense ZZ0214-1 TaxID=1077348 RepID=A0A2G8RVH8_9APHY|nr:hypothetical protein GSI_12432 [Ganoderma sinense ZZ0214-1]